MQWKKSLFNGLAAASALTLLVVLYHLSDSYDNYMINQRKLLSSSPSSSSSSLSSSSSSLSKKSMPPIRFLVPKALTPPSLASTQSSTSSSSSSSSGPDKRHLLLVTKGRSGSSFTSALIRNDRNVFYTFEPLFVLGRLSRNHDIEYLRQKAYSIFRAFLQCEFSEVSGKDLDNFQIRLSSPLASHFLRCMRTSKSGPPHLDCLFDMIRECRNKTVTFAKVIRFPMIWAEPVLKELPNLKILYLIRDPRAVLNSQARVFHNFKWPSELQNASRKHCGELEDDIAEIERLQVLYPGRIYVIKYERGATEPMDYAKDIYRFSDLDFTEDTEKYVNSLKMPDVGKGKAYSYSVHRTNGSRTMNSWRYRTGFNSISQVDKICDNVYHKMGYHSVTSQRDLESTRPLVDMDMVINKEI